MIDTLAIILLPILAAMAAGYLAGRLRLVSERVAEILMLFVTVGGYPSISLFSVWATDLRPADAWLPVLGMAHIVVMTGLGAVVSRGLTRDHGERGLFALASALGNQGATMGGFVIYQIYGDAGLGRASVMFIMWVPMTVLFMYPVARHYAEGDARLPLPRLLVRSLLDWRSLGLPVTLAGIALSLLDVPRPAAIERWHVLDVLIYAVTVSAYFSIGLRLHVHRIWPYRWFIGALAGMRFVVGPLVGALLGLLTYLTPWALDVQAWSILLIQTGVATAVTMAALANMFGLRPHEASVLFVTNTVLYLAVVLPIVLWVFG